MVKEERSSKLRWGELLDGGDGDDDEYLDFLLPPKEVYGPDKNGIKKVVEYKFDEDGRKVKVTTTTRLRMVANARLSKRAVERRAWTKFGDAVREDVGNQLTMVSTEEILLERPRAPGTKQDETKAGGNPLSQMAKGGATLMLCRTCGKKGDHWTAKCPYKDLTQPNESNTNSPPAEINVRKGAYVPPSKRGGASADIKRRNDENSVRVSNLSEDTRDADLLELFQPFGPVSRAHVVFDRSTGASRGFGYVNFVNREHGERAISKLDGYGYDNLILRVEWSVRS